MTTGNFWPPMTCNVELWKGEHDSVHFSNSDTSNAYSRNFNWNTSGIRRNHATSCREIMSNDLRATADAWNVIFKDQFDPEIQKRITLNINKNAPSKEWMYLWRPNWVFPDLIKSYKEVGNQMQFVLNNKFFAMGAPQPVFSMSFFFLNRYEAFSIEQMSDPDKMIQHLLAQDEGMWQGSSRHGPMAFSHAFAVYVRNIVGDVSSFHKLISCNGVGSYVLRELIIARAKDLGEFVERYKINVNDYISNSYSGSQFSVGQILAAVRSNRTPTQGNW